MDSAKSRFMGIPLGIVFAIVVNGILFMGLPLLTQIQRSFQSRDLDSSILLTQHKPPKPPDPEKDKKLKEKKPKKVKQKKNQQRKKSKPKIDLPKFSFGAANMAGNLAIAAAPRQELTTSMLRTAFTLSEVDQPPRILRKIDPLYPFAAKRKNIQGSVTLRFIVTKEGTVVEPSVVKSEPPEIFDSSALKAIIRWRFKPAIKDGKAVDVIIIAPLKFKLQK